MSWIVTWMLSMIFCEYLAAIPPFVSSVSSSTACNPKQSLRTIPENQALKGVAVSLIRLKK